MRKPKKNEPAPVSQRTHTTRGKEREVRRSAGELRWKNECQGVQKQRILGRRSHVPCHVTYNVCLHLAAGSVWGWAQSDHKKVLQEGIKESDSSVARSVALLPQPGGKQNERLRRGAGTAPPNKPAAPERPNDKAEKLGRWRARAGPGGAQNVHRPTWAGNVRAGREGGYPCAGTRTGYTNHAAPGDTGLAPEQAHPA